MDGKVQVSFITVAAAALTGGHKQTAAAAAARQKQTASGGIQAWKCDGVSKKRKSKIGSCVQKTVFSQPNKVTMGGWGNSVDAF